MPNPSIDMLTYDNDLRLEIFGKLHDGLLPISKDTRSSQRDLLRYYESVIDEKKDHVITSPEPESVVLEVGRPSLLIREGRFENPVLDLWVAKLNSIRESLESAIAATGRIEVKNHPDYTWIATGWLVSEDIIVTNRHVALKFARRDGDSYTFKKNPRQRLMSSRVDFREEYRQPEEEEFSVEEILYIEDDSNDSPDIAFLRVANTSDPGGFLASPIELDNDVVALQDIAAIGYPMYKSNSGTSDEILRKIFNGIFDVKRLAPGKVNNVDDGFFTHDCSTLPGSSGSVIIGLNSGKALGLHFSGSKNDNYAISASVVAHRLANL